MNFLRRNLRALELLLQIYSAASLIHIEKAKMHQNLINLDKSQLSRLSVNDLITAGITAIESAGSFQDVKDIRDKAEALRVYQRSIGAAQDAVNAAAEIRIRAERRMGEELRQAPLSKGAVEKSLPPSLSSGVSAIPETIKLADIGITYNESSRFQHLADIPEDTFDAVVQAHKNINEPISAASVARAADAIESLPDDARQELIARGESEILREANRIKREKKQQKQANRESENNSIIVSLPTRTDRFNIIQCHVSDIPIDDESIDCIITDPPYPKEFLSVYDDLAKTASRVLKPGGSCFVMIGQSYLPNIINSLSKNLNYQWIFAYMTPGGQATQLWQRKVNTFWKPVLWFVKGEYDGKWMGDVAKSNPNDNDKRFHHWGQSESGMADLINRFSDPGQTILDPFVGGGTTGVVALDLDRRFIGCDIDEKCITQTITRINTNGE
jgi:site-specific DNA-methyltransferase (adenine-specific)